MGGSQSRRDESFRANQWEQAHDIQIPPQSQGQYTVVRNRVTGQLLDKYSLQFPNENQYNKYLQSINHRQNQPFIVRVIHYEPAVVKQFCGSSFLLYVYLQHCKSRLSQYQDIPFPDYLYCAMALLEGYKKLYNKVGRFYVSERQAMIDNDGQIRVWLNQDFSENQAQDLRIDHYSSHNPSQQQYAMVQDIMRIIFQNSDLSQGPGIKLVDFYQRQKNNLSHRVGFEEAKSIIHEYSRINQIQIPDIFKSVYQIYQAQADERQYQDTLSFKNQLFNQNEQEHHNSNKVGHSYEPVQSIVNTSIPLSTNFINRPNPVYHSQISPNNLSPRITTNIISNHSISNMQVPISTQNYGFSSQPSFAQHVLPSINPISMPVYPQIQRPPIQQQIQPQISIRSPQQGFPITIRPLQPPVMNNIPLNHNPVSYPNQHFQNFSIPRQNKPIQPIININRPPTVLQPVNNQPIQQIKPLFQQFRNNSPKANFEAPNRIENTVNNKFVNQQDEHQIQKKILKQNTIFQQDVNEANIIRDLNQLHKIQQQEKSRRSINQDNSRNLKSNTSGFDRDRQDYNIAENDDHHRIDSSRKYSTRNQYYEENRQQNHQERQIQGNFNFEAGYVTESLGEYGTTQYTTSFQNQINKKINNQYYQQYEPPRQQINQSQTYSGFNPHSNNQTLNFNGTLINKNNQRQFNQYNTSSNQLNQISINQGFTSQDLNSKQIFKTISHSKKQSYYTLSSEVQLDPQIAADLASYIQS